MALAMSSGPALLLAYCVTGLALWTIDSGVAGRSKSTKLVAASAHARIRVFDDYVKPIVRGPVREQTQPWPSEASTADNAPGKREELRELRRRAMRAFMVITLLKGSNQAQLGRDQSGSWAFFP
jgi:hypothetical protein